jgi:hypothetical protein
MSATKPVQDNFTAGEVSPKLYGRVSHDRYKNGAKRLENCIITPQGSISKRNGTKAVRALNMTDEDISLTFGNGRSEITGVKVIQAVFSREEAYAIVFTKTSTGVKTYVYSNGDADLMSYQTGDDTINVLDRAINIDPVEIPNEGNTGVINITSGGPYYFGNYEDAGNKPYSVIGRITRTAYLMSRSTGQAYGYSDGSFVAISRSSQKNEWYFYRFRNGVKWAYKSSGGSATTAPTTGWSFVTGSDGTDQSGSIDFDGYNLPSGTIEISEGYNFDGWTTEDIDNIDYDIYKNSVIITTPNQHPLVIRRFSRRNEISGLDDYRHWTIGPFPFEDGPYLAQDIGKSIRGDEGVSFSATDITLTLTKQFDTAILQSNDPDVIINSTNLDIGEYIEYRNNDKILLGQISSVVEKDIGIISVEPVEPIIDILDSAAVYESDNKTMSGITRIYSDTTVFSRELEYGYLRHRQVNDAGSTTNIAWFQVHKYTGQRNVSSSDIATNQFKVGSGYNNVSSDATLDTIDVSHKTSLIHYCAEYTSADTTNMETLSSGEFIFLSNRSIVYTIKSDHPLFVENRDIGRWIRLEINEEWSWGVIAEYTSDVEVTVVFSIPPPITRNGNEQYTTNKWQFGAYYDKTGDTEVDDPANFPAVVSVIEDRIFFGGGNMHPDLFHLSNSDKQEAFGPTDEFGEVLDTSAISYRLPSSAGEIKWAVSVENLLVGTTVGEYKISSSEQLVSLTPTNIRVKKQTQFGSLSNSAIAIDGSVIFIQAPGKGIRELTYSWENDSYRSINISVVAEHLFSTADPVQELSYVTHPDNLLLCRTKRGRIIAITYDKENRVVAACPWTISGLKPYDHETAGVSDSYVTADWVASTTYNIGSTVRYNGIYFQCVDRHTSTDDFLVDYTTNVWVHTGAPVISMCSLPAKDDRSSDKFIFLTYRKLTYEDPVAGSSVTPASSDFLCIESLEPFNSALSDSYYFNNNSAKVFHADFSLTINDSVESYIPQLLFDSGGQAYSDICDTPTDITVDNDHLAKFVDQMPAIVGNSTRLLGFSFVTFGIYVDGTGTPKDAPQDLNNAFVSPAGSILDLSDNLKANRIDNPGIVFRTYLTNSSGEIQYLFDQSNFLVGWSIGFTFPCVVTPLPIEFAGEARDGGGSIGRVKRINEVSILVEDTGEFDIVGDDRYTVNEGNYQFTGVIDHDLDLDNESRQEYHIVSFSANRLNILAIGTEMAIKK